MHEVKVYGNSGKFKKMITPLALEIRSKQQMETPSMFRRNKKGGMPWSKSPNKPIKVETQ